MLVRCLFKRELFQKYYITIIIFTFYLFIIYLLFYKLVLLWKIHILIIIIYLKIFNTSSKLLISDFQYVYYYLKKYLKK